MARPGRTYDDLQRVPDVEDGKRYEIIDGELFVTPSPGAAHQRASRNLLVMLHEFVTKGDLGEVFHAPFDVIFTKKTVLIPDLMFISQARSEIVAERGVEAAPDLVAEVLSKGTRTRSQRGSIGSFRDRRSAGAGGRGGPRFARTRPRPSRRWLLRSHTRCAPRRSAG